MPRSTSPARAARTPVLVPLGRRILLEKKIVAAAGAPTGGALALVPTIEAVLYGSLVTDGAWAFAELDGARLERALVRLLATYPMLAGTFEAATSAVLLNNAGVRYSRYRQPGSFTGVEPDPERGRFADCAPPAMFGAKWPADNPIMTVMLTEFDDAAVVGVAIWRASAQLVAIRRRNSSAQIP